MSAVDQGRIGELLGQDAGIQPIRLGRKGAVVTQDAHGRYLESIYRGNCYLLSTGSGGVALGANTLGVITTAATAQPIVGILNPSNSGVLAAIYLAAAGAQATGATPANEGVYIYADTVANASTTIAGTVPTSLKTLTAAGSKMVGSVNQAYTGNTSAWAMLKPFVGSGPRTAAPTASINVNTIAQEELSGIIQIPPGFGFGIGCLSAGTAITSAAYLIWEEFPYP